MILTLSFELDPQTDRIATTVETGPDVRASDVREALMLLPHWLAEEAATLDKALASSGVKGRSILEDVRREMRSVLKSGPAGSEILESRTVIRQA